MSILEIHLFFQWWAVDESRMMGFEYSCHASKYSPVIIYLCILFSFFLSFLGFADPT